MVPSTVSETDGLYAALLNRRSVRRYDRQPLSEETLAAVRRWGTEASGLVAQNRYTLLVRDVVTGSDLVEALGAYGRMLSPPHFLVPYMVGEDHVLLDLGYRTQQLVIRMWEEGIGSCYIGALDRETTLRALFVLRRDARIAAAVIFGRPASSLGRGINAVMRTAMGSTARLPVEKIFFNKSFSRSALPSRNLEPLITVARQTPSALNVQPWRFLWWKKQLWLFVRRKNPRYGAGDKQDYRYFDAGLCMANVTLALRALKREGAWSLLAKTESDLPPHPAELEPIAVLRLG